jgi:uncharacterized protein (TIGR02147 family)
METTKDFYIHAISGELSRRCDVNPRYSLRAFAKACDISPGVLSQFLSGKRVPSYNIAQKIASQLGFEQKEHEMFMASLALKHQQRGLQRISPAFKKTKVTETPKELSIELFKVIGDWYHYALLMLTCVESFKPSIKWMASQIGISEIEAKLAIERLIEVGLLKSENGTYACTNSHFTTSDKHLTSAALKRHVKQSLEKAIHSVDNDPIAKRSMTYMTMAIDETKIPEAKILIEEFTNKMSALLETGRITKVYEYGVYLYPLQKDESIKENV